ncbi:TauD/TfdA family dioxygenase [Streptomyces sp. NPDC055078]
MPDVIENALFTAHRVDVHAPEAEPEIARRLRTHGLVTVEGLFTRRDVLALATRLMHLSPHPDSDPDGLTAIQHTQRHAGRLGYAGLGQGELAAHTERAQTPRPPRLMILACEWKAVTGGESLLIDGREALRDLALRCPEAVEKLSKPRSVYFGTGAGHPSSVFTPHPGGRVSIRLRRDGLARWSPLVQPYLEQLEAALLARQQRLDLSSGQAYILDNHRWLHARTEFSGRRRFLRALGEPRFEMPVGFTAPPAAALTAVPGDG